MKIPDGRPMPLSKEKTLIGRNPDNDVVMEEMFVSRKHCAIEKNGSGFLLIDLKSSNGTFVNGRRIAEPVRLQNNDTISFGKDLPAYLFRLPVNPFRAVWDFILRQPRWLTLGAAGALLLILLAVLSWLLFFRSPHHDTSAVTQGLSRLERIHGTDIFPDDPEFLAAVGRWVDLVKSDQAFQSVFEGRLKYQEMIENILTDYNLPTDYSLIVWAESQYNEKARNYRTGAAGLWQLLPRTARAYGLRIDREVDERLDPTRSTQAAALYLTDLVSMFGKDSFLLVLAAYNAGDSAVLYGLKQIQDPVKDRNFWYLYTHNLIPAETKQYVLKILALAVISQGT